MAEDQDEIMILDHAPLPLPRQQLPAADRELGHGQVQARETVAVGGSHPLVPAPPRSLPSLDAPLGSPNAASASQFERNPSVHGGLASSATPDPLPAKVDGHPSSSVLANAPWLDSPVLPTEAFDKQIYHIPDYAGWFSLKKIHAIERRSMPEFFDGNSISKTPKLYKEYRDFIINKFKENPGKLLTFTEVRRMLPGDVNVIKRLFDFVEYWGLINYQNIHVMKHPESAALSPSSETVPPGVQVVYPHIPAGVSKPKGSVETNGKSSGALSLSNLVSYRDAFVTSTTDAPPTASSESIENLNTLNCSSCGANCELKYYGNTKGEGVLLCEMCFSTGNDFIKDDFVLREADLSTSDNLVKGPPVLQEAKVNAHGAQDDWTKEEVLRLLEALTKYKENWDLIAHHVETRSKAECIMQFMKLPFGDQFIDNSGQDSSVQDTVATVVTETEAPHNVLTEARSSNAAAAMEVEAVDDMPPSKRSRMTPRADTSNPILDQVAFLSAMVGPRIAAAAAQAALVALAEEDPISSQFLSSIALNQKNTSASSGLQVGSGRENVEAEFREPKEGVRYPKTVETESSLQTLPSATQIRAGIATAIGAVAANAKLLADQEEREIEHLMAIVIENQMKKLCSKVEHFKELEHLLKQEHIQIGKAQAQVLADWIRFSHYNYSARRG